MRLSNLRDPSELVFDRANEVAAPVARGVYESAHVVRVKPIRPEARRRKRVRAFHGVGRENTNRAHRKAGGVAVKPHDVLLRRGTAQIVDTCITTPIARDSGKEMIHHFRILGLSIR